LVFETINLLCVKSQKTAYLIYTAAGAWKFNQQFPALLKTLQFCRLMTPAQVSSRSGCLEDYENLEKDKNSYKHAGLVEMIIN
jgi:hypothetical protein